jgi:hypothetical protein
LVFVWALHPILAQRCDDEDDDDDNDDDDDDDDDDDFCLLQVYAEYANSSFNMNPMLHMVLTNPKLGAMFGRKTSTGKFK